MAKRTNVRYQGVKIALPKGARTLTADMKATIDAEYSDRRWNLAKGDKCRGVFFTRANFVLRCDKNRGKSKRVVNPKTGRKVTKVVKVGGMSKAAKTRFSRQQRRGELCLRKTKTSGKVKLFTSERCRKK